jgi:ABC-type proline/glycine betaine transport system permease subunit
MSGRGSRTFVAVLSMIPPLAILPILFIVFGLGELSKVVLIVIGITPFLIRDMSQRTVDIPRELIVKAETLGASSLVIALRVALPQIMPRLIQAVRLSLGPAWLFLIAAEAIASDLGLGYRIFLVRRYLAMDVILTYVIWITLLAFSSTGRCAACRAGSTPGRGGCEARRHTVSIRKPYAFHRPFRGAPMSFVKVRDLFQSYGTRPILERVNLTVTEGEFISIVGASGCGKSTFLRLCWPRNSPPAARSGSRAAPRARARAVKEALSSNAIASSRT